MYRFDEVKHVHYFDEKPLIGTSTACHVIAKPLTWWASGVAVGKMGWIYKKKQINGKYHFHSDEERLDAAIKVLDKLKESTAEEYVQLLDEAYRAHNEVKEKAADTGTARHKKLEEWVKQCIVSNEGAPLEVEGELAEISSWAMKNISKFLWSEVHGYSLTLWTGGIADVGWLDMEGKIVAADWKSSKEAYFDQFIQIGGYDTMLAENGGFTAEGEKVFTMPGEVQRYCVIPFGQEKLDPVFLEDVSPFKPQDFRDAFVSAVKLHKLQKSYGQQSKV